MNKLKNGIRLASVILSIFMVTTVFAGCTGKTGSKDVSVDVIYENIKNTYGDNYIPNSDIPSELLESVYGLSPSMYTELWAQMPMMSTQADTVIVVKAESGKGSTVEKALTDARDRIIADSIQYPMNIAKVNATKVVRNGDYVAFLMVGAIDDSMADPMSEEAKAFAEAEVQKGVDAFNKSFE